MAVDPEPVKLTGWALVLGASSGFGAAASLALARAGCNIFGVHFDRKSTQPMAQRVLADIQAAGREAHFFNVNAADEERRADGGGRDGARPDGDAARWASSGSCSTLSPSAPSSSSSPSP